MKKINSFKFASLFAYISVFVPFVAFAQATGGSTAFCDLAAKPKLQDLLGYVTCIIYKSVIPLFFAIGLAAFVYGVVQYVINDGEESKKAKGRQFMIWGLIGLTVMFSIWGLVSILSSTFNLGAPSIPQLPE